MNIHQYKKAYFIGIGGIGMSALARWFVANSYQVAGYDRVSSQLTETLQSEGMLIHYSDDVASIPKEYLDPETTLIIYTPAIPKTHTEKQYFEANAYQVLKRSEVLGLISQSQKTYAIAGTHGKTTTCSILAHVLYTHQTDITAFVGGIMQNYNTNFMIGSPDSPLIIEADEYDRSFLTLSPEVAVITSTDADHLDIYGDGQSLIHSFEDFVQKVHKVLIVKEDLSIKDFASQHIDIVYTFGIKKGDYSIERLDIKDEAYHCDVKTPNGNIKDIHLSIPGEHNLLNMLAAIAVAQYHQTPNETIAKALNSFEGAKRRFEYVIKQKDKCLINDYAHHPTELKALITTVQKLYPKESITIVFQPHLYTRTRDFATAFAESLSLAQNVILLDIYPARELPIEGVNSEMIAKNITTQVKVVSKTNLKDTIKALQPKICIIAGAGDIELCIPEIKEIMQ